MYVFQAMNSDYWFGSNPRGSCLAKDHAHLSVRTRTRSLVIEYEYEYHRKRLSTSTNARQIELTISGSLQAAARLTNRS